MAPPSSSGGNTLQTRCLVVDPTAVPECSTTDSGHAKASDSSTAAPQAPVDFLLYPAALSSAAPASPSDAVPQRHAGPTSGTLAARPADESPAFASTSSMEPASNGTCATTSVRTADPSARTSAAAAVTRLGGSEAVSSSLSALHQARDLLRSGHAVAIPTETVYGLAANALSAEAVHQIFLIKGRPADNPLIVHVSSVDMLVALYPPGWSLPQQYVPLVAAFWPGPLTLLLPRSPLVPDAVTAGLATMAVRLPAHPVARALIELCGFPLAAPSANMSGRPSPTSAEHVMVDLTGRVPLILDGGPCSSGVESTVLDALRSPPAILRPGGVTFEQLRDMPGMQGLQVYRKDFVDADLELAPSTPGMKYRHYSPTAQVVLLDVECCEDLAALRLRLRAASASLVGQLAARGVARIALLRTTTTTTTAVTAQSLVTRHVDATPLSAAPQPASPPASISYSQTADPHSHVATAVGPCSAAAATAPALATAEQPRDVAVQRHAAASPDISHSNGCFDRDFPKPRTSTAAPVPDLHGLVLPAETLIGEGHAGATGRSDTVGISSTSSVPPTVLEINLGALDDHVSVAQNLFAALRAADEAEAQVVVVEGVTDGGTGLAIMNRLRKAATVVLRVAGEKRQGATP